MKLHWSSRRPGADGLRELRLHLDEPVPPLLQLLVEWLPQHDLNRVEPHAPHRGGTACGASPTKRFRSAWFGIIVHSIKTVFFVLVALGLVPGLA
jgi:hypothetical protein